MVVAGKDACRVSKPKRNAWMPLYVGDYLRDTARLSTEQHGAYFLLIMDYWVNGPLPDDDAALATIARLAPGPWKRARAAIAAFFQIKDGCWNHKRLDHERAKTFAITELRRMAGSSGADKRWGKPVANGMAKGLSELSQTPGQIDAPSQPQSQRIPSIESRPAPEAARLMGEPRPRAQSGTTSLSSAAQAMIRATLQKVAQ
jgi:uncharacterized protein YdaU (DUF1376 family)